MRASLVLKLACSAAFLLAVALVQVVKSINVERYRSVLAAMTMQATGHAVDIRGRLSLRLSLSPGIEANALALPAASAMSVADQLTIGHLDADVALLPLLAGEVRVQKLTAEGVTVLIEQAADGTLNWSMPLASPDLTKAAMPATRLDITQVELRDVEVRYSDRVSGRNQRVHFNRLMLEAERSSGKIALTAVGLWGGQAFNMSGVVGSWRDFFDSAKPFPVAMKAVLPGLVTTANGTIEHDPSGRASINLAVTADALDIGAAARLFGWTVPPLGGARASFTLSGAAGAPRVADLDLVFGRRDALAFAVKGAIGDPFHMRGVDVAVTMDGENLPAFGRTMEISLPALGPLRVSTHLTDTADGWHFSDIKGRSRQNDLAGHLFVTTGSARRPTFEAAFETTAIDLGDLWGTGGDPADEHASEGRVFSDRPLPFALLGVANGRIDWKIGRLTAGGLDVGDVQMPLSVTDGQLQARFAAGRFSGGRAEGVLVLDTSVTPPQMSVTVSTDKVEAGPVLAALGVVKGLQGLPTDLHVSVTTNGDNAHAIASKLAGEGSVAIGPGSFVGGDGGDAAPWMKRERVGVTCGYSHFTMSDGLAVTESIIIDLTPVTIGGRGSINFGREELDLVFVPRPKDPGQSGALVPLDVDGTLRHPSLIPARGTAVKGVAPALPPMVASGNGASACQSAVTAKKPTPLRRPVHPLPASGPGAAN